MNRTRHGVALAVVGALAVVTLAALQRPSPNEPVTATTIDRAPTTTSTSTTPGVSTTTTTAAAAVEDRETEVEQIVGDLYFAWFDGVHRQDMETVRTVAGLDVVLEWAEQAFETVEFTAPPTREAIGVEVKQILLDRADCLVVSANVDYRAFLDTEEIHSTVDVYFRVGDGWGFAVKYMYERELWQVDCDLRRRPSR